MYTEQVAYVYNFWVLGCNHSDSFTNSDQILQMARKLLILTIVLAGLAYLLYDPYVPPGYSTSTYLRLTLVHRAEKFGQLIVHLLDRFDIVPMHQLMRTFCALSHHNIPQPTDEVVKWYDTVLDGVPVRVYEPREKKGLLPGFVYYHGGGWVICNLDSHHAITHLMAKLTNTVLISVDYRLAPEHPFPAAHDDCFTATKSFLKNPEKFGVDPTRVAIGGDSAGGNLAATVALRLRDENVTPPIKVQVLIYPITQHIDLMVPSYVNNQHGLILHREEMKLFFTRYLVGSSKYGDQIMSNAHIPLALRKELESKYLNLKNLPAKYTTGFTRPEPQEPDKKLWDDIKDVVLNPYSCPILAANASGLPTAYIYTGEYDLLRDDGFLYAHKLREAGNRVEHFHHDIGFHAVFQFAIDLPETQKVFKRMADFVAKNL